VDTKDLMISVSGVRGVVGKSATPEVFTRFAAAYGMLIGPHKVMVGMDTRQSGDMIKHAVHAGLISVGCQPMEIGICPTPTIGLMVRTLSARGGVAITASHNPAEWNAVKFFRDNGLLLNESWGEELLRIFHGDEIKRSEWQDLKPVEVVEGAILTHLSRIMGYLDASLVWGKRFKVALDCCNGAGSLIGPQLLQQMGCEPVLLNVDANGKFPHDPEPVAENLQQLSQAVRSSGADVGFAQDADVDRIGLVDETGRVLGEEYTLALAIQYVLSKTKGPVVTNLSTSRAIEDIAKAYGCELVRTKVGEVNVAERMVALGSPIGGEGNGGVILPEITPGRDATAAMGLILECMAASGRRLSELADALPKYAIVKKKYPCPREAVDEMLQVVRKTFSGGSMDETQGIRIDWDDAWLHIRPSGTEPVVRVIAEAREEDRAEKLCDRGRRIIQEFV